LVRRGLASSPEQARAEIEAGLVTVAGAPADKPARLVAAGDAIVVHGPKAQYVSRGGEKLDAALERFGIDVHQRRALDAGASTGGFTDCLLQRGAREVVAVDVGYGQLHEHLRADPRVRNVERCNVRSADPADLGAPFEIVVADLSFISLDKVLDVLIGLAGPGAPIVVLVKPQFEAARHEASRGRGVITEPAVWRRVLDEVMSAFEARGGAIMGAMVSPLRGAEGNVEFLLAAQAPAGVARSTVLEAALDPARQPFDPARQPFDIDAVVLEASQRWSR
jgi:23S rRNA (cytidine1920-2'-O)/16S rRNA (cytidine1409-2'-O)-methyltransferase